MPVIIPSMKPATKLLMLLLALVFSACSPAPGQALSPTQTPSQIPPPTLTPFQPLQATSTASAAPNATFTPFPLSTITPDPFRKYTISAMRSRAYGSGTVQIIEKLDDKNSFTRYKIRYTSDGLTIYGFMNIPKGEGPFPVIIAIHGNYNLKDYQLMPYSTYDADVLSRAGYLVIHPNMRGFGESDSGDDRYRTGLAIDILNLIGIVKTQGLQIGTLEKANPERIGIWAHSLGGEVALRVITISRDVKATMLYAPMTGDIIKNAKFYYSNMGMAIFQEEINTPTHLIAAISPHYSFGNITSALKLYHGTGDPVIPVEYGRETCQMLTDLGKEINCAFYEGAKHTFNSNYTDDFHKSFLYFFKTHLLDP